jgi:hypothetical protein
VCTWQSYQCACNLQASAVGMWCDLLSGVELSIKVVCCMQAGHAPAKLCWTAKLGARGVDSMAKSMTSHVHVEWTNYIECFSAQQERTSGASICMPPTAILYLQFSSTGLLSEAPTCLSGTAKLPTSVAVVELGRPGQERRLLLASSDVAGVPSAERLGIMFWALTAFAVRTSVSSAVGSPSCWRTTFL